MRTNHPSYERTDGWVETPGTQVPAGQLLDQKLVTVTSRLAEKLSPMLLNAVSVKVVFENTWTQKLLV